MTIILMSSINLYLLVCTKDWSVINIVSHDIYYIKWTKHKLTMHYMIVEPKKWISMNKLWIVMTSRPYFKDFENPEMQPSVINTLC